MGLDMYLLARPKSNHVTAGNVVALEAEGELIGQWRKHRDLHRFIESKWREATGSEDEFNGVRVPLSRELLMEIRNHSLNRSFPAAEPGFFFGESTEDDHEQTIGLTFTALKMADEGYEIIYDSWW